MDMAGGPGGGHDIGGAAHPGHPHVLADVQHVAPASLRDPSPLHKLVDLFCLLSLLPFFLFLVLRLLLLALLRFLFLLFFLLPPHGCH